jgi:hypothetical protein
MIHDLLIAYLMIVSVWAQIDKRHYQKFVFRVTLKVKMGTYAHQTPC